MARHRSLAAPPAWHRSLPTAPPARHRSLQPAEPAPHQGRNSDFALPPRSEFRLRFLPGQRRRSVSESVLAGPLAECFFSPFTRPAVNPGVGTGLPHSILAWAQDCPKNPSPGHRRRCVSDAVLAASLTVCFFSPFTRPAVNPGVGTGLPHSILAWAQDCHTQSWCEHRIAPVFPRKRWKRSAAQHYAPRLAARIARKKPAVRRYTAMHSRTRRPDCPENYGSALLYSRTLPEKTGCDAVNMAFLPGSPPFPASNLASNAKEMGKIKLFPTTEYSSKQPSGPVVPLVPCTGIFLGIGQNRGSDQPDSGAVSRRL